MTDKYFNYFLVAIICIIVFTISTQRRFYQFEQWKKNKSLYFIDNITAVTTLDAYHWLRYAEVKVGIKKKPEYDLRKYPDIEKFPKNIPFLSWLIAKTCNLFNNEGYNKAYVGGIKLINITASLFVIPLIIYVFLSGGGFAGVLGALIGSFSWAYYIRSCTGRIDTDSFVLVAPILLGLFMLLSVILKNKILKYIFTIISGVSFLILSKAHNVLNAVYFIYLFLFIVALLINKNEKKEIIILTVLFIICSNPIHLYTGFHSLIGFLKSKYILNFNPEGDVNRGVKIIFPSIIHTITETQKRPFNEIINMVFGIKSLALIGLAGSIVYFIINFKKSIFLIPVFCAGLMAFITSNRFAMFLAPFVGLGIGYFFHLLTNYSFKFAKPKLKKVSGLIEIVFCIIFFFSFQKATAYNYIPRPSIPPDIVRAFIDMKHKLPSNSAIFTWWDFGYALMDIGDFYTYHDGGVHGGARTYFVGKAYTLHNQEKFYNMLTFFDNFGFKKIKEIVKDNKTPKFLLNKVLNYKGKLKKGSHIYILYTRDMIGKFGAISFFGNWDFNKKESSPDYYQEILCNKMKGNILYCSNNLKFDLLNGIGILPNNRKFFLKRSLFINNGYVISEKDYVEHNNGLNLQIEMINNRVFAIYLLNDNVFYSNFNQQYMLGKIDKRYFKEVFNRFPTARVFEVINK